MTEEKKSDHLKLVTGDNDNPTPSPEDIFNNMEELRKVVEHKVQKRPVVVNMAVGKPPDNAHFQCRRRRRIEGFEVCEQITQRVPHRLEYEGGCVVLGPIEVLTCELAHACRQAFVPPSLLEPPRIKPARIHAGHAARTGQQP